jgi:hypothetical protein
MRALALGWLVLWGQACASRTEAPAPPPPARAAPAAAEPARGLGQLFAPAPGPRPAAPARAPAPEGAPSAREVGEAPTQAVRVGEGLDPLFPPAEPGRVRYALEGCLAAAEPTLEDSRAHAIPASRGGRPPSPLKVTPAAQGIILGHELTHACCLRAALTAARTDGGWVVTEELVGQPCRCLCRSSVRAAVGLPRGAHELTVRLVGAGEDRTLYRERVEVR